MSQLPPQRVTGNASDSAAALVARLNASRGGAGPAPAPSPPPQSAAPATLAEGGLEGVSTLGEARAARRGAAPSDGELEGWDPSAVLRAAHTPAPAPTAPQQAAPAVEEAPPAPQAPAPPLQERRDNLSPPPAPRPAPQGAASLALRVAAQMSNRRA